MNKLAKSLLKAYEATMGIDSRVKLEKVKESIDRTKRSIDKTISESKVNHGH